LERDYLFARADTSETIRRIVAAHRSITPPGLAASACLLGYFRAWLRQIAHQTVTQRPAPTGTSHESDASESAGGGTPNYHFRLDTLEAMRIVDWIAFKAYLKSFTPREQGVLQPQLLFKR
jgi:hypothetical protein